MKITISSVLKKLAQFIEEDRTPTDEDIRKQRQLSPGRPRGQVSMPAVEKPHVQQEKYEETARPQLRSPRALPECKKEWNEDTKTEKMREYQRARRTDTPDKLTVKKPKI